jgi:ABC-type nickel/cobalt efflux system permease component RcnA
MKKLILPLLIAALFISFGAHANPFMEGRPAEANSFAMSLFATPFMHEVMEWQRRIHEMMTDNISALQGGQSLAALWWLLLVSFGYGVFHVLAPGHGKVIVASYFLGNKAHWLEGVWAGLIMAVGHTITAIAIVVVLYFALGLTQFHVLANAKYLELIGYGLIALIGLWMLFRAFKTTPGCHSCGHDHGHDHHHGHHHHEHAHDHDHGHKHDGRGLFAVTSLVPCSGSMIILLFTVANNVLWAGILAVIAIALGMWITVTVIGIASIFMRRFILGDEEKLSGVRLYAMRIIGIAGALLIMATGSLLFAGTLYGMGG